MGLVHADITLINGENLVLAKRHIKAGDEVKRLKVNKPGKSSAQMK